jgi:RNA polymerase sigma-70 factor (ECF subfamily)
MSAADPGTVDAALWDPLIRAHDRAVWLSLLGLGLRPDRAREIAQSAWIRLMEKQRAGELASIDLPGLAIRQARYLALDSLRQARADQRLHDAMRPEPNVPDGEDLEARIAGRRELDRVAAVLAGRPENARALFGLLYGRGLSQQEAAHELKLSLQRVRQLLCETRKAIREALEDKP